MNNNTLDDTISDFEYIKKIVVYSNYNDLYTKDELKIIYTNENLSSFLGVPLNTKTNMYTILKRVRLYINNNGLCVDGVIKPNKVLSSILIPTHKYNRIIHNTLLKYINV